MTSLVNFLKVARPKTFEAKPRYIPQGDMIVFFFDEAESYAERVDHCLTVYRSFKTNQLTGCKVKGVKRTLGVAGDFERNLW